MLRAARAVLQVLVWLRSRSPWVCSRAVFQGSQKHWAFVLVFLLVGGREEEQFAFLLQDQLQASFLRASCLWGLLLRG